MNATASTSCGTDAALDGAAEAAAGAGPEQFEACPNCSTTLPHPKPNFCAECGQETTVRAPRLSEFVQQFGGAYLSTEGALWRTLKLLIFRPGELTRQYLAGRRKHYVLPLRLYLTVSLLSLLVMRIAAGVSLEQEGAIHVDMKAGEYNLLAIGDDHVAGMKEGRFVCVGLPAWLCKRIERKMDVDEKGLKREIAEAGQRFVSNIGLGMFAMLPAFALLLKLHYWNRRFFYTEHLVFALHLHAFWFVALPLIALPGLPPLVGAGQLVIAVYTWLALRRVYGGRWWPRALRVFMIGLLYLIVLSVVLTAVAAWTMIF